MSSNKIDRTSQAVLFDILEGQKAKKSDGSAYPFVNVFLFFHTFYSRGGHAFIIRSAPLNYGSEEHARFMSGWAGVPISKEALRRVKLDEFKQRFIGLNAIITYRQYPDGKQKTPDIISIGPSPDNKLRVKSDIKIPKYLLPRFAEQAPAGFEGIVHTKSKAEESIDETLNHIAASGGFDGMLGHED